ncbi:MAG: ADP-ribosylglycohydrolase family protein [Lentisphaeria bacterium]|nr:ADP-ribosylglycohydrolase family protein [Lentisphaeria bacterium]
MKTIDYSVYRDRILACWTGKSLGGIIGAPYECHKQFKPVAAGQLWPKVLYPNDDLDIQVVYLEALQEKGLEITSFDLAQYWMDHCFYVCCEYGIFADNFEHKIYPPYSGIWNNDWYKASMGCPIRSEIWGIICAGNPALAAEYAAKDGCLDHGKDSIEIEQFWSAAAALAFFETDLATLLEKSLAFVPAGSLAEQIYRSTKAICAAENDAFRAWKKVIRQWGHRNATAAQTNFALTLMALLLGENDFRKTMHVCVQSGWDADCTAATAGALLGLLHGTAVLPSEWCGKMGKNLVCACEIPHQFASLESFAEETALLGVEMAGLKNDEIEFSGAPTVTVRRREKPRMELHAEYQQTAALFFGKPTEVKLVFSGKSAAGKRLKLSVTGPAGLNIDCPSEIAVSVAGAAEAVVRISCPDSMQWMDSRNFFRASVSDETGKEAVCEFGLQGARQFSVYGPYWDMWDMKKYKVCPYDCEEQTCNPGNLPGFRDAMDMYVDLDKPYLNEAGLLAGPLPEEMPFAVEIGGNHLYSRDLGSFQGTCCYYLVRTIRSQADLDGVSCSLGSDVPAKMWIDGKEVFRQEQHLALVGSSNEKMMLDLRKGEEHRLVIKVAARADSFELRYGFSKGTETRKRAISPYVGSISFRRG